MEKYYKDPAIESWTYVSQGMDRLKESDPSAYGEIMKKQAALVPEMERRLKDIRQTSEALGLDYAAVESYVNDFLQRFPLAIRQDVAWDDPDFIFLYILARIMKPKVIIETGTNIGFSSTFFALAVKDNNNGCKFYTMEPNDIPWSCATFITENHVRKQKINYERLDKETIPLAMVPHDLRKYIVFNKGHSYDILPALLKDNSEVGIFFHDSEHSYRNTMWECLTAMPYIKNGGYMIVHDITENSVFKQLFPGENSVIAVRNGQENILGIARKTGDLNISAKKEWLTPGENGLLNDKEYAAGEAILISSPREIVVAAGNCGDPGCFYCSGLQHGNMHGFDEFFQKVEPRISRYISQAEKITFRSCGTFFKSRVVSRMVAANVNFLETSFPEVNKTYYSNGTDLSPEVCRFITRDPIYERREGKAENIVNILLCASNARLHKSLTGNGDFSKISDNIRRLVGMRKDKNNPLLHLTFTARESNIEDFPDFVKFAAGIGADKVVCEYTDPGPAGRQAAGRIFDVAVKRAESSGVGIEMPSWVKQNEECRHHAWGKMTISPAGQVLSCDCPGENLMEKDFMEAWNNRHYQDMRSGSDTKTAMGPFVRFTWNMLYDCNYRCTYCFFEGKWEEYRKRNVYLSPDEWMKYWESVHDKYGQLYLNITGGEPFIYPNFIEIIRRLSQICYHINISTNSSGDLKTFAEQIDPQKVSLSLSFQPQFDKFEDFIERVIFIRKHKFNGCLNFVAYPPFLKDLERYEDKAASIGESLKVIPFFGEYRGKAYPEAYTEEEKKLIGIDDAWFKKVRKKGALCFAGQKTALIFPDGKVARCGQVGENMVLGSFFDKDFKLLDAPLPCQTEYCPCDEGSVVPEDSRKGGGVVQGGPLYPRKSAPHRVFLAWDISTRCNYNCSYCGVHDPLTKKETVVIEVERMRQIGEEMYRRYGSCHIRFSGGEPFIYPDFIGLLRALSEYHALEVSTNLSIDVEEIKEKLDPKIVLLSSSFHPEFADFSSFLKKVLFLKESGFHISVTVVGYPLFLRQIKEYKEAFEKNGIHFIIQLFCGSLDGKKYPEGYSEEEKALLKGHASTSLNKGADMAIFEHKTAEGVHGAKSKDVKKCHMGHMYAKISSTGGIFRCCSEKSPEIGNILTGGLTLLEEPADCEIAYCPCWKAMITGDEAKWLDKWEYAKHPRQYASAAGGEMVKTSQPAVLPLESKPKAVIPERKIYFTWDIHYKCNFRCPYCWFFKKWVQEGKRNVYLSPEEWMVHWKRIYDKYGPVRIEITGGEPFIYPNFIKLIKLLSAVHTVKITTNMSGDIETFVKEISPQRVNLDLNFHPTFSEINAHIKKTLLLKNAGFNAGVCYLAYPPQMKMMNMFKKRFEEKGINFALAAFWGEYGGKRYPAGYTAEEIELIRPFLGDIDRLVYHLKGESPKGKLCYAGHKYAVVQADGKIVRCGQLADKFIGSIFDENFRLFDTPMPCEADVCPCNEYINVIE